MLPFGRLWYDGPNAASNAIGHASQYSRSHGAVIHVYNDASNVTEMDEEGHTQGRLFMLDRQNRSEKIRSLTPNPTGGDVSSTQEPHLHLEVGHILFLDIVGYSKLLSDEQKELVQELNQIVRETEQFRAAEAEGNLTRLPTGDGMVLVFTNNPEAPVECALEISKALHSHPKLKVRMGIHSGPVNPVADVNDQSNLLGAGINVAPARHVLWRCRTYSPLQAFRRRLGTLCSLAIAFARRRKSHRQARPESATC